MMEGITKSIKERWVIKFGDGSGEKSEGILFDILQEIEMIGRVFKEVTSDGNKEEINIVYYNIYKAVSILEPLLIQIKVHQLVNEEEVKESGLFPFYVALEKYTTERNKYFKALEKDKECQKNTL